MELKKYLSLLLMLVCSATLYAQGGGIQFVKGINFKEALAKAKKENKQLFMDCYTSWCVPCAKMAKEIFPLKECGDYFNPKFINIQVDMEKGEGVELMKKLNVQSFPTFIFFDADGNELNRIMGGSPDAKAFLKRVDEALKPGNSLKGLQDAFDKESNYENGMKLAKAQIDHGMDPSATLDKMYLNPWESQRYSTEYMQLVFSTTDFRSPRFDRLMFDRQKMNKYLGKEVVNDMIFNTYRKDMYLVAAERPHNYTKEDVRKAAFLTAMLELPIDMAESYLPQLALYVLEKDYDAMIRLFENTIKSIPSTDTFKGILNGLLSAQYKKMDPVHQKQLEQYFQHCVDSSNYDAKIMQGMLNGLKNNK